MNDKTVVKTIETREQMWRLLEEGNVAAKIGNDLIKAYLEPAFGALSKTELDNLVFKSMVENGLFGTKHSVYGHL